MTKPKNNVMNIASAFDSLSTDELSVDCQKDADFMEVSLYDGESKSSHFFRLASDAPTEPESEDSKKSTQQSHWDKISVDNETPYVFGEDAVKDHWVPPKTFSCLPEHVEKSIPDKYKYWEVSDREDAAKARDSLVARLDPSDIGLPSEGVCKSPNGSRVPPWIKIEFPKSFDQYVEWNSKSNSALWSSMDAEKFAVSSQTIEDLKALEDEDVKRLKSRDWDNEARASAVKPSNAADRLWKFEVTEKHIGKEDLESCVELADGIKVVSPDYSFDFSDGFHFFDDPDYGLIELKKMVAGLEGKIMISTPMDRPLESVFPDWDIVTIPSEDRKIVKNYDDTEEEEDTLKFDVKFINKQEDEHIVGGVVYESGVYDADGEWASKDTVRDAMIYFMENGIEFSVDHKRTIDAQLLECFQAEESTMKGSGMVPEGAWYVSIRVKDSEAWQRVRSGDLKGFSWEGKVLRERNSSIT